MKARQMPYCVIDGLRMHYLLEGDGPAVLLLHGLGSRGEDWMPQIVALAGAGYTALAPDLRGHGKTDKPPGPYTIHQMADDVNGLLERLVVERAAVVGLSLGGLVAQSLAVRHPARVRALVLVNTFARLRLARRRGWSLFLRRGWSMVAGGMKKQAETVARELFPRPEQEGLRRIAARRLAENDPAAYQATVWAVLRFDGRRDLERIQAPTLVVAGAEDTTVSLEAKQELATRIPNARLEIVPGSGHATPLDRPEAFNRLLLEFLRG
ncbi:MAG TPA: alpha/beta fold hydrolase [Chloroflexi bacterium]|nr:alpha/beta fold hydrolase [Chloroflexota bacterium]